jgi:hypothetical protein
LIIQFLPVCPNVRPMHSDKNRKTHLESVG